MGKLLFDQLKETEEKLYYYVLEFFWCVAGELIFTTMGQRMATTRTRKLSAL